MTARFDIQSIRAAAGMANGPVAAMTMPGPIAAASSPRRGGAPRLTSHWEVASDGALVAIWTLR